MVRSISELKDKILWLRSESVGTAQVSHVEPGFRYSMVFLDLKPIESDITGQQHVFVPRNIPIGKGRIVEVLVRKPRYPFTGAKFNPFEIELKRPGGIPENCCVAIRLFDPKRFREIDEKSFQSMYDYPDNHLHRFFDGAFFRRFLGAKSKPLTPEDIQGPIG